MNQNQNQSLARKQTLMTRRKQAGVTLIEAASTLGLFALLVGGALMMFGSSNNSQGASQHTAEATGLRLAMKQMFNGQGNYGSATATYASANGTLVTANKVPSTMSASGTTITNKWGGTVAVMGNNVQFYVSTASVPQDVCVTMVSTAIQQGWSTVGAGGAYPGTNNSTSAVSPSTAASTYCAAGGNTLYLTSN